jgi:hypothetical protein
MVFRNKKQAEEFIRQIKGVEYAKGGGVDNLKSLNGYFQEYNKGIMAGKRDEGYVTIKDEYDLKKYITNKLGNVVKKINLIERGKSYPYNRSNPYFEDTYDVELKDGTIFKIERYYGRPLWSGNVSYVENIKVIYGKGGSVYANGGGTEGGGGVSDDARLQQL